MEATTSESLHIKKYKWKKQAKYSQKRIFYMIEKNINKLKEIKIHFVMVAIATKCFVKIYKPEMRSWHFMLILVWCELRKEIFLISLKLKLKLFFRRVGSTIFFYKNHGVNVQGLNTKNQNGMNSYCLDFTVLLIPLDPRTTAWNYFFYMELFRF